jgi:hypothetical protein
MANFESPIGKKTFTSSPMRNFDVPDANDHNPNYQNNGAIDYNSIREFQSRANQQFPEVQEQRNLSEVEREIREAREAKKFNKEKISDGAKRRIEMLLGMTQSSREVQIEGNTFTLRSLKSKEVRDAIFQSSQFDGTTHGPFEIRKQFVARSLTHIAGLEIEQFLGSNSLESKLLFIDELDDSLSSRLYNEYLLLSNSVKEKFAIKTEEDAKEVMEDLKK